MCCSSFCMLFFFFNDTATTEIYTLSLHDALPIWVQYHGIEGHDVERFRGPKTVTILAPPDRKSTRLNSSHVEISYAVFCLKKKKKKKKEKNHKKKKKKKKKKK